MAIEKVSEDISSLGSFSKRSVLPIPKMGLVGMGRLICTRERLWVLCSVLPEGDFWPYLVESKQGFILNSWSEHAHYYLPTYLPSHGYITRVATAQKNLAGLRINLKDYFTFYSYLVVNKPNQAPFRLREVYLEKPLKAYFN